MYLCENQHELLHRNNTNPTGCGFTDGAIVINGLADGSYTVTYDDPLGSGQSLTATSTGGVLTISGLG